MIFNATVTGEILDNFYQNECFYFAAEHFDITHLANIKKYTHYKDVIYRFVPHDTAVTDVGCGRGGFVKWLYQSVPANHVGIDIDMKSLPKSGSGVQFFEGSAIKLPLASKSQKILCYFHVLEHIIDLDQLLSSAFDVLENDGFIVIEVPNASKYSALPVSNYFWQSIREHISHFTPQAVQSALNRHGFFVELIEESVLPTPEFSYPSLLMVARKICKVNPKLKINYALEDFFIESHKELHSRADSIMLTSAHYDLVAFWGISNQLLSLFPLCLHGMKKPYKFFDKSELKQQLHYMGCKIEAPSAPPTPHSCLFIASPLHFKPIFEAALAFGWKQDNIFQLVPDAFTTT